MLINTIVSSSGEARHRKITKIKTARKKVQKIDNSLDNPVPVIRKKVSPNHPHRFDPQKRDSTIGRYGIWRTTAGGKVHRIESSPHRIIRSYSPIYKIAATVCLHPSTTPLCSIVANRTHQFPPSPISPTRISTLGRVIGSRADAYPN